MFFPQIGRLEANLQQLQLNLASSHQKHKTDVVKLQEQIKMFDGDLSEAKKLIKTLEHELASRDDALSRSQTDLRTTRDEISGKNEEVCY